MKDNLELTLVQFIIIILLSFLGLISFGEMAFIDKGMHYHSKNEAVILDAIEVNQ